MWLPSPVSYSFVNHGLRNKIGYVNIKKEIYLLKTFYVRWEERICFVPDVEENWKRVKSALA